MTSKKYLIHYYGKRVGWAFAYYLKCIIRLAAILPKVMSKETHIVFDFSDGIYADFYFPIYAELKKSFPKFNLWISYSSKYRWGRETRFDQHTFIPNPLTYLFRHRVVVCASIPSSVFLRKTLFHTKRVQIFHGFASMGSAFGKEFVEAFDRVFTTAVHLKQQLATEEYKDLIPQAKIFEVGYPKIDGIIIRDNKPKNECRRIFYGPTYHQEISSIFNFLPELIRYSTENQIELYIKLHPLLLYRHNVQFSGGIDWEERIKELQKNNKLIRLMATDTPFATVREVFLSTDLFVTDVSGLGYEFCLITGRPVVFLGTKLKIPIQDLLSDNTSKYMNLPEIKYRGIIGPVIKTPDELFEEMEKLQHQMGRYLENINTFRNGFTTNLGFASTIAAKEINNLTQEFKN